MFSFNTKPLVLENPQSLGDYAKMQPAITKPALRGYLHQAAFYLSMGAGLMLVAAARTPLSRMATIIYVLSLVGLFGFSALYHRPHWGEVGRRWLRPLDHAWIFVMIAGSATPILVLGMPGEFGNHLLWFFWIAAAIGATKCFFWPRAPKFLNVIIYIGLGCSALPFLPSIRGSLGVFEAFLLFLGGLIYSLGALVYYFRKPNPYPRTFGYHEIFHAMVVIASALHFKVIYDLVSVH